MLEDNLFSGIEVQFEEKEERYSPGSICSGSLNNFNGQVETNVSQFKPKGTNMIEDPEEDFEILYD